MLFVVYGTRKRASLLLVMGLLGCGAMPGPADTPTVELGTGMNSWESLPLQGGRMELVMGPQGGWHLLARLRYRFLPNEVSVRLRLLCLEGTSVLSDSGDFRRAERRGLTRWEDGYETTSAELVILAMGKTPADVVGRVMLLEAQVSDPARGQSAQVRIPVTVVDERP